MTEEEIVEYKGLEYKKVGIKEKIKRHAIFRNRHGALHSIKHEQTIGKTPEKFYYSNRNFYNRVMCNIDDIKGERFNINNLYNGED